MRAGTRERAVELFAVPVADLRLGEVKGARLDAAAHRAAAGGPDAVAHVGVGGVVDARLAHGADVVQVLGDLGVAAGEVECDLFHVVQRVAGEAIDAQAEGLEALAQPHVGVVGVVLVPVEARHHPLDAELLDELQVLVAGRGGHLRGDLDAGLGGEVPRHGA